MAFVSKHATLIWDKLHRVNVPDQMTLSKDYLKVRGVYVTGDKETDALMSTSFITIMTDTATLVSYFKRGVEIRIPERETMVTIYNDIELYLQEWRDHIKYDINLSLGKHKEFIGDLEALSKYIYDRLKTSEMIASMFRAPSLGISSPITIQPVKDERKPDYDSISNLIRTKTNPGNRF